MADQGSEGFLSPWLRKKRFKAVMPYVKGSILDYGCGTGFFAEYVLPDKYIGVDIDKVSLDEARLKFPEHFFFPDLKLIENKFDSIISLAVIEHTTNPVDFLIFLSKYLRKGFDSQIIITTPHPSVDWIHNLGSRLGLFSRHANEEHEELLNKAKLVSAGKQAGLKLILYKRFLLGANQVVIFRRVD